MYFVLCPKMKADFQCWWVLVGVSKRLPLVEVSLCTLWMQVLRMPRHYRVSVYNCIHKRRNRSIN
jgi:hypothetical protein